MKKFENSINIEALKGLSFEEFKAIAGNCCSHHSVDVTEMYNKYGTGRKVKSTCKPESSCDASGNCECKSGNVNRVDDGRADLQKGSGRNGKKNKK